MRVLSRGWFLLLALLAGGLWPAGGAAVPGDGAPSLTATVDPEEVPLGGRVVLTLAYGLPAGATLPLSAPIGGLDDLTLVARGEEPGRIRLTFLVDRLGTWETGPLSLTYLERSGQAGLLTAEAVTANVLSNLGERPAQAVLKPPETILPTRGVLQDGLGWWLGGGALALMGALAAWWYGKRRRQRLPALMEPPHVKARRALAELEQAGLWERGQTKAYYFGLSAILRRYLEHLRGFPAAEMTTPELAARLKQEEDRRLLAFLRQADLVKFAGLEPSSETRHADAQTVAAYIEATAPPREEPAAGAVRKGAPA